MIAFYWAITEYTMYTILALIAILLISIIYAWSNYKACSSKLAWTIIWFIDELNDTAQCSKPDGQTPSKCKRYHGSGPSGWWYYFHMTTRNWLNRGCHLHDTCLQHFTMWSGGRDNCDDELEARAFLCKNRRSGSSKCHDGYVFSSGVRM